MRDRLYAALGQPLAQKPFAVQNVQPEGTPARQPQQAAAAAQQQVIGNRQRTNSGYYQVS